MSRCCKLVVLIANLDDVRGRRRMLGELLAHLP